MTKSSERAPCADKEPLSLPAEYPGEDLPPEEPELQPECLETEEFRQDARIIAGGFDYPYTTVVSDGEIYVSPAEFIGYFEPDAVCEVKEDSCRLASRTTELAAEAGEPYFTVNGRYIWRGVPLDEPSPLAPLGAVAAAAGLEPERDGDTASLSGEYSPPACADDLYDADDLYWLSRIICCEAKSESLTGKIAVGNVVLNRVRSSEFPDDVEGVVFDSRYGVIQFSPVAGGNIYNDPDDESVAAAKLCLEGVSVSDRIIYFMNPAISTTTWISDNRDLVVTIGNHSFYS